MKHMMFKILLITLTLGVVLASLSGCKAKAVQLTDADNTKDITLDLGTQLVITLPGNPSTGYSWEVKSVDGDILELVGEPQFVSDNTNVVGAGGQLSLTFEALKAGSTTLELVYLRSWEADIDPLQTFIIQVTVK